MTSIVFSSSCAIYGVPISEHTVLHPINPYGFTKLVCEQMMDDFGLAHASAGADPTAEIGEHHDPES